MRVPLNLFVFVAFFAVIVLPAPSRAETIAIVNVSVIDGSGTPPRPASTVVISDGVIAAWGGS